tara:strand:- start:1475 stop:1660 length:186 start_codon:yes stop_codon:yes gene_type:complete
MLACIKYIKMEAENKLETEYIHSLSEIEKKGYEIAKSHLGSSFSLKKSIGFKQWKKNNKKE